MSAIMNGREPGLPVLVSGILDRVVFLPDFLFGSRAFDRSNPHSVHALIRIVGSVCALAFVLIPTGFLSGCALYGTYEKCGIQGCPGDAKITADVVAQFSHHLELEPNAITVQTLDRVVYLYGLVSSSLEIGAAESVARKVPNVKGVVNSVVAQTR